MSVLKQIRKWIKHKNYLSGLNNSNIVSTNSANSFEIMSNNHFTDKEINTISINLIKLLPILKSQIKGHDFNIENNGQILRENNPKINNSPLYKFYDDGEPEIEDSDLNYEKLISDIFLSRKKIIDIPHEKLLNYGRILGFKTLQSIPDGAPISESNGFVDNYDIPPIDCWIYYKPNFKTLHYKSPYTNINEILFCWIPNQAIDIMNETMEIEALKSYFWLDEHYPDIQKRIEIEIITLANN